MKIVTTLLTAVVMFGAAGIAQADSKPFLYISATTGSLEFGKPTQSDDYSTAPGKAMFPGVLFSSSATFMVQVESNCLHGPVIASITTLRHPRGSFIAPERIFIKSPTTNGYVTMAKPVVISRPEIGSHDIDLNFRLEVLPSDRAGQYQGTITFTIMPPPP